ncbi:MAG: tRNA uridine-5-carboxymethylaminomethyl(34) synthesis GTPase MnmE [Prevotellaceae bacterium]|nr:tRNA uridine-5-carboxymethylaminomethyl(34) synthesis GTPase MnmE [Candidatus Faecinaster equi]
MNLSALEKPTICAIATGQGGAISIIRVSGNQSIIIADKIFIPLKGKKLTERMPYSIAYGNIIDNDKTIVDDVLISIFKAPHSYTGEDSVEISCHCSAYIQQRIIEMLIDNGCEMAEPGEFTKRAFLNGKMDLSQAEAVADLIQSTSQAAHHQAINQMKGGYSMELKTMRDQMLRIASLMELELDFSDHEELEFVDRTDMMTMLNNVDNTMQRLCDSFHVGNAIRKGIPVAIVGKTNVGKSTLLNTLAGEDKAIVSDIHGTTRDSIEETVNISGIPFRFIDTAGLRQTNDEIEKIGISRTYDKINQSQIVLQLIDSVQDINDNTITTSGKLIVVVNKIDNLSKEQAKDIETFLQSQNIDYLLISAKIQTNIDILKSKLIDYYNHFIPASDSNANIVTNIRHYEALQNALLSLHKTQEGLEQGIPTDLVAEDLRQCLNFIGEIVGDVTSDEILHSIFKHFCIGK